MDSVLREDILPVIIALLVLLESIRDYGRIRATIALLGNIGIQIQLGFHLARTALQVLRHMRDQRNAFAPLVNMMSLGFAQIAHPGLTAT